MLFFSKNSTYFVSVCENGRFISLVASCVSPVSWEPGRARCTGWRASTAREVGGPRWMGSVDVWRRSGVARDLISQLLASAAAARGRRGRVNAVRWLRAAASTRPPPYITVDNEHSANACDVLAATSTQPQRSNHSTTHPNVTPNSFSTPNRIQRTTRSDRYRK